MFTLDESIQSARECIDLLLDNRFNEALEERSVLQGGRLNDHLVTFYLQWQICRGQYVCLAWTFPFALAQGISHP